MAEVSTTLKKAGIPYNLDLVITYSASGNNKYRFISSSHSGRCTTRPKLYQYICEAVGQPKFDYTKYL